MHPSLSESNPAVPIELQRAAVSPGVRLRNPSLAAAGVVACASRLFFRRRKLFEQVRPIASDNAAYLVIDGGGVVVAFLNLPVEHFQFVGTERATV
jgi:hypothetical protein